MRVTAAVKEETRRRILDSARDLLAARGWDGATTRDIADAAGIAHGTVFNYFPTREAIAMALLAEAVTISAEDVRRRRSLQATLEEDVFALMWRSLRKIAPLRAALPPSIAGTLDGDVRDAHMTVLAGIFSAHGRPWLEPLEQRLYWMLYTGALAFWLRDTSPKQEETLALIDRTVRMFLSSL